MPTIGSHAPSSDRRDGWLRFTQFKGRNRKPITLEMPIPQELAEIINATECGELTFLVNELGRTFTANGGSRRHRAIIGHQTL